MYRFFAIILAVLAACLPARAQTEADAAYETLHLHAGGTYNINRGALRGYWQPGYGVDLGAATPFHVGHLEAGTTAHRFVPRSDAVPRYNAFFLFAGWGFRQHLSSNVSVFGSARLGNYLFWFDDDTPGLTRENELTAALHGRITFPLPGPLSAYVSGTYQKTFTSTRMYLWFTSAGLSHTLRMPDWLKRFLR